VFDATPSARIEGSSVTSGRITKPPGTSSLVYPKERYPCRINKSAAGVDSRANIEGGSQELISWIDLAGQRLLASSGS
jgi:hypothetical protein